MCGIFFYLGHRCSTQQLVKYFKTIKYRGPDNSNIYIEDDLFIGFHRLIINDLSYNGTQPMFYNNTILICNGEIYNYKHLIQKYDLRCKSNSDCEVIVLLYEKLKSQFNNDLANVAYTLCNILDDSEFAFVLYDKELKKVIVGRDRYGIRPLFIGYNPSTQEIAFASEMKALTSNFYDIEQFRPSSYSVLLDLKNPTNRIHNEYYLIKRLYDLNNNDVNIILSKVKTLLENSVYRRMDCTDVPYAALLSGGFDSSLICGIISNKLKTMKSKMSLHTFSIGLQDSEDLKYAKQVAQHIESVHHEIVITPEEMLDVIEEVVYITETFDITTIRASIPNYLLAKFIAKNTDFKVLYSGEMSDENGYYLYFKDAPNMNELHIEVNKLLYNVCYFDALRCDRCISSNGLEARVPFSDFKLISYLQSINPALRTCTNQIEKYLLRKAFEKDNLIPNEVLWRRKEGFSDSVSTKEMSWHKILQHHIDSIITTDDFEKNAKKYKHCTPLTKEAYYYRTIFEKYYAYHDNVIPYFWMPNQKWYKEKLLDPSARELKHY